MLAFATGSSEAVMPQLMDKLEDASCNRAVVGLVIPTGYSFNLDGASIYLSLDLVFLAQAVGIDLSLMEQLTILGVLLLTCERHGYSRLCVCSAIRNSCCYGIYSGCCGSIDAGAGSFYG